MTPANDATRAANELLPCPFCGAGAVYVAVASQGVRSRWRVECQRCQIGTARGNHYEAQAMWNTRLTATPPPPPVADAGAFEAAVGTAVRAGWNRGTADHIAFADEARDMADAKMEAARAAVLRLHAAACDAARNDGWHAGLVEGRSQGRLDPRGVAAGYAYSAGHEDALRDVAEIVANDSDDLDDFYERIESLVAHLWPLSQAAALTPADDAGAGGAA